MIARKREILSINKEFCLFYCHGPVTIRSAFMALSTVLTSKDRCDLLWSRSYVRIKVRICCLDNGSQF